MLSITISYNSHIVLKVMNSKLNPAKEEKDCQVKLINVYRIKKQPTGYTIKECTTNRPYVRPMIHKPAGTDKPLNDDFTLTTFKTVQFKFIAISIPQTYCLHVGISPFH